MSLFDVGSWSLLEIVYMTIYILAVGFAVFFTYWLAPLGNRCRFLNFLTKRDYGIIEVAGKGKSISRDRADFRQEIAILGHEIYILDPDHVYTKEGVAAIHFNEVDAIRPISLTGENLTEEKFRSLPPVIQNLILSNPKDPLKIYLHSTSFEKRDPKEKYANPEMIDGIFMKQKSLAESQTLFEDRMFKMLLYICLAASVIAAILGYLNYDQIINAVLPNLHATPSPIIPAIS
jgi:hypothetical protein